MNLQKVLQDCLLYGRLVFDISLLLAFVHIVFVYLIGEKDINVCGN
jgi:hypothetical protein